MHVSPLRSYKGRNITDHDHSSIPGSLSKALCTATDAAYHTIVQNLLKPYWEKMGLITHEHAPLVLIAYMR
jgi:hypothetical protein